ncbi:MAG: hypothetical protein ABII64_01955 [Elusimicrobiota bacterium]
MDFLSLTSMDPATIPLSMKLFFGIVKPLAYLAVIPLFILAILDENAKLLQNDIPNYSGVVFKAAAVIMGLFLYNSIFMSIVALCQAASFMVFSMEDWSRMQSIIESFRVSGTFMTLTPDKIMLFFTKYLSSLVEEVFLVIRYAILSLLYMIGPFAFVFALYKRIGNILGGWFKNVVQVAFWIISLRILQSVFVSIGALAIVNNQQIPPAQYLIFTVTYFVLVLSVPAITSQIFVGGVLGPIASIAMGASTAIITNFSKTYGPRLDNRISSAVAGSALGRRFGIDKYMASPSLSKMASDSLRREGSVSKPSPKAQTAPKQDISSVMPAAKTPGGSSDARPDIKKEDIPKTTPKPRE